MNNIILVGDVGSTKSSWWITGQENREIILPGFNPVVHDSNYGQNMMLSLSGALGDVVPNAIWYYGTGIIDARVIQIVKSLLHQQFPESVLHIHSDLEGAAIAACGNEPGTIAILGTGSHAAVFDGNQIIRQANSLGYILGDEGGGCDIGKSLLQAYFYNQMPESVRKKMDIIIPGDRTVLLNQLYSSPSPNQYLATYAQVAGSIPEDPWIKELVRSRFLAFIHNHLIPLKPIETVHILGSIGCIFADLIEKELSTNALKAGIFLNNPSYRLFSMHTDHGINKK